MIPVILDITNQQQIDEAFNKVTHFAHFYMSSLLFFSSLSIHLFFYFFFKILATTGEAGLLGLVNNAAVPHWCPVELLPIGDAQVN